MLDCVKKGLCDLFRNKLRSFLTIGGIAIGVLSVVIISSIGDIAKITINAQLDNMGMDSVVVSAPKSNESGLVERDLAVIKSLPGIKNAMPLMNIITESTVLENNAPCMIWGVNEDADDVIELIPIHGRLLNKGDVAAGGAVCVVDEKIALDNYKRSNIIGKTVGVKVGGSLQTFTVVGVVKNGVNMLQSMMGEFIPSFVYVPYTTLQTQSAQYYFDQIAVKLKSTAYSDGISAQVEEALVVGREVPTSIQVDNLLKQKGQLNNIMSIITAVLSIIAGISLIVSGLSIMTVMLVSVNERTREIGIKKSIGATNTDILAEFLMEAVLITLLGGIIGTVIGISASVIGCIAFDIGIFINMGMIGAILIFSLLTGLIFGVYPAFRAAKLKPVDALRHE